MDISQLLEPRELQTRFVDVLRTGAWEHALSQLGRGRVHVSNKLYVWRSSKVWTIRRPNITGEGPLGLTEP